MPSGTACAAKFKVLPFEKQEEYDEFLAQPMEDEKPVGLAEIHVVRKTPGSSIALSTGQGDRPTRRRNASVKITLATEADLQTNLSKRQPAVTEQLLDTSIFQFIDHA